MQTCEKVEVPKEGEDLRVVLAKWAGVFMECYNRHEVLVEHIHKRYPELQVETKKGP